MKTKSRFVLMIMLIVSMTVTACNKGRNDNNESIFLLFLLGNSGGDTVISIAEIPGVTPPNYYQIPVTTITETDQYTGTVAWSPNHNPFAATTVYTATITLTAKPGYTLTGVAADFFTVASATSVTNDADSGIITAEFPATEAPSAGDMETYTADGVSFAMAYVPGGTTFPTETNDLGTPATVDDAYWIGETEVTYELWYKVRTWARANGYTLNANPGREGNDGTITPGAGAAPTTAQYEPVTTINWREAMVWCNALTEWYNANNGTNPDLDCVYYTDSGYATPIRSADATGSFDGTAGGQDNPYVNAAAKGFRLLASNEWELAARWRDDATNTVSGYTNPYFTQGDSASGDTQAYNAATPTVGDYAVYADNSSSTATVKSKTNGYNALGLYDMSGNVTEMCFDLSPADTRFNRGGHWDGTPDALQVGAYSFNDSWTGLNFLGFRFARTQ